MSGLELSSAVVSIIVSPLRYIYNDKCQGLLTTNEIIPSNVWNARLSNCICCVWANFACLNPIEILSRNIKLLIVGHSLFGIWVSYDTEDVAVAYTVLLYKEKFHILILTGRTNIFYWMNFHFNNRGMLPNIPFYFGA